MSSMFTQDQSALSREQKFIQDIQNVTSSYSGASHTRTRKVLSTLGAKKTAHEKEALAFQSASSFTDVIQLLAQQKKFTSSLYQGDAKKSRSGIFDVLFEHSALFETYAENVRGHLAEKSAFVIALEAKNSDSFGRIKELLVPSEKHSAAESPRSNTLNDDPPAAEEEKQVEGSTPVSPSREADTKFFEDTSEFPEYGLLEPSAPTGDYSPKAIMARLKSVPQGLSPMEKFTYVFRGIPVLLFNSETNEIHHAVDQRQSPTHVFIETAMLFSQVQQSKLEKYRSLLPTLNLLYDQARAQDRHTRAYVERQLQSVMFLIEMHRAVGEDYQRFMVHPLSTLLIALRATVLAISQAEEVYAFPEVRRTNPQGYTEFLERHGIIGFESVSHEIETYSTQLEHLKESIEERNQQYHSVFEEAGADTLIARLFPETPQEGPYPITSGLAHLHFKNIEDELQKGLYDSLMPGENASHYHKLRDAIVHLKKAYAALPKELSPEIEALKAFIQNNYKATKELINTQKKNSAIYQMHRFVSRGGTEINWSQAETITVPAVVATVFNWAKKNVTGRSREPISVSAQFSFLTALAHKTQDNKTHSNRQFGTHCFVAILQLSALLNLERANETFKAWQKTRPAQNGHAAPAEASAEAPVSSSTPIARLTQQLNEVKQAFEAELSAPVR